MKRLTKALKIIAIVLNTIFLAGILLIVCSKYGARPENLFELAGFILIFGFPAVTLITIALTFGQKCRSLTFVLRIIAIIINASFLVIFIFEVADSSFVGLVVRLVCIMGLGLPILNVVALALTFIKGKEKTAD
ncbi:MAG: hypothetical protein ACYSSN_02380 [Planctomycetota bacterium]|jgi:hypothetical protein